MENTKKNTISTSTLKLICNECYAQELVVHDYDGKLYVDACECQRDNQIEREAELESHRQEAYDAGYTVGYGDGIDEKVSESE